jgi:hypothetical protein
MNFHVFLFRTGHFFLKYRRFVSETIFGALAEFRAWTADFNAFEARGIPTSSDGFPCPV